MKVCGYRLSRPILEELDDPFREWVVADEVHWFGLLKHEQAGWRYYQRGSYGHEGQWVLADERFFPTRHDALQTLQPKPSKWPLVMEGTFVPISGRALS